MRDYPPGPACEPERFARSMLTAIAGSYLLDGLLLGAFVWAGVVAAWVPLAYVAAGLACCAGFRWALTRGFTTRCGDRTLTMPQLAAAAIVQLSFIVLAPAVALYFVGVMFIVFAFAALRLPLRDAVTAWIGVSVAITVAIALLPQALDIPHETLVERVLVCVSILLALGRCILLGAYGRRLRLRIGSQYAAAQQFLETRDRRAADVARELHEDLGQDLAGIALALTAHATRLQREGRPGADGLAESVMQLRVAIEKTRTLAGVLGQDAESLPFAGAMAAALPASPQPATVAGAAATSGSAPTPASPLPPV